MTDDSSRSTKYEQIRNRFLSDPEFRDQVVKDPSGTLESILGPLTDQERSWLDRPAQASATPGEPAEGVRAQLPPLGFW